MNILVPSRLIVHHHHNPSPYCAIYIRPTAGRRPLSMIGIIVPVQDQCGLGTSHAPLNSQICAGFRTIFSFTPKVILNVTLHMNLKTQKCEPWFELEHTAFCLEGHKSNQKPPQI